MQYISLKHLAKQRNCSQLIALFKVMQRKYHYIMTERNGIWVLVNNYNEPLTKQDIQDKIDANKAQRYLEHVAHNGIFSF